MNAEDARLKSRACMNVPAKYRPSTLADCQSARTSGSFPQGAIFRPSANISVCIRKPVQRRTASYSSVAVSPSAWL